MTLLLPEAPVSKLPPRCVRRSGRHDSQRRGALGLAAAVALVALRAALPLAGASSFVAAVYRARGGELQNARRVPGGVAASWRQIPRRLALRLALAPQVEVLESAAATATSTSEMTLLSGEEEATMVATELLELARVLLLSRPAERPSPAEREQLLLRVEDLSSRAEISLAEGPATARASVDLLRAISDLRKEAPMLRELLPSLAAGLRQHISTLDVHDASDLFRSIADLREVEPRLSRLLPTLVERVWLLMPEDTDVDMSPALAAGALWSVAKIYRESSIVQPLMHCFLDALAQAPWGGLTARDVAAALWGIAELQVEFGLDAKAGAISILLAQRFIEVAADADAQTLANAFWATAKLRFSEEQRTPLVEALLREIPRLLDEFNAAQIDVVFASALVLINHDARVVQIFVPLTKAAQRLAADMTPQIVTAFIKGARALSGSSEAAMGLIDILRPEVIRRISTFKATDVALLAMGLVDAEYKDAELLDALAQRFIDSEDTVATETIGMVAARILWAFKKLEHPHLSLTQVVWKRFELEMSKRGCMRYVTDAGGRALLWTLAQDPSKLDRTFTAFRRSVEIVMKTRVKRVRIMMDANKLRKVFRLGRGKADEWNAMILAKFERIGGETGPDTPSEFDTSTEKDPGNPRAEE